MPAQGGFRISARKAFCSGVPLITIDPADAKDHDDAVYAEPDRDLKNAGGHIVYVAIADVAAYVRPRIT